MDAKVIGLSIKKYRKLKKLSFTQLKKMTNISVMDLQLFEDGLKEPTTQELGKIADALDVPVAVLNQED